MDTHANVLRWRENAFRRFRVEPSSWVIDTHEKGLHSEILSRQNRQICWRNHGEMYTQDGVYIPPSARDATFASETLRKPKGLVDAARLRNGHALDAPGGGGRPAAAVLAERAPTALGSGCTVYSHRVDRGVYPDADVFGTTVGGVNPFGRNSAFSMPVTDPRKKEEDAA